MTVKEFNLLEQEIAKAELSKCCGSGTWVEQMMHHFPFSSVEELQNLAVNIWYGQCVEEDWLEAFKLHPKIGGLSPLPSGGDLGVGTDKFASTNEWAGAEQAGVQKANEEVIHALAKGNKEYKDKFGFIFIVCATGKSAEEMLAMLNNRITNSYESELKVAMKEQHKITEIRLKKLIDD
jgi:OHCU decarboxylase